MAQFIKSPSIIEAAGNKEKIIREFFGHVNSKTTEVSIAHMTSPEGWVEPGQKPEFSEYTLVLKGKLRVTTRNEEFEVTEGQGIMTAKDEWVQYSTPFKGGAEYIAVCLPAFSPDVVHRDDLNYY
jgi:mannose-6-phosphate isomerase-like protein (cupin superfamily)